MRTRIPAAKSGSTLWAMLLVAAVSASAAEGLTGSWSAAVGEHSYDLTFDDANGLSVVRDNRAVVVAEYEIDGTEVTITDLGGSQACSGEQATGVYGFSVQDGAVTFERVSDNCEKRASVLDGNTFQRSGE